MQMKYGILCLALVSIMAHAVRPKHDLIDIQKVNPNIQVKLYFATADNFAGKAFYNEGARAYLRGEAAQALSLVQAELETLGFGLLLVDAYRPVSIQKVMWESFPNPEFVIDPSQRPSRHNCGLAVDVMLIKLSDNSIACQPSPYFGEACKRDYKAMECTPEAKQNCKLLELTMENMVLEVLKLNGGILILFVQS